MNNSTVNYLKGLKIKQLELDLERKRGNYDFYKEYFKKFYGSDVNDNIESVEKAILALKKMGNDEARIFIGAQRNIISQIKSDK